MPDMVNHPAHYTRGPALQRQIAPPELPCLSSFPMRLPIECIDVIRHIGDMRLATAVKYIWRVAFGGKANDREDIEKAIWYLHDWLENPL